VIVGVHSPEFDFEKVPANVTAAVKRLGVTWPVAIDSQMGHLDAYQNQYWPAEYLLDQQGRVAYTSFGEGDYPQTERRWRTPQRAHRAAAVVDTRSGEHHAPKLYAGACAASWPTTSPTEPSAHPRNTLIPAHRTAGCDRG